MTTPLYWVSPREANLLITGRCNLRCKHCSVTSHGDLNTDLPLSQWVTILDELQRSKLIRLTITGGEPLCRPDFVEFLAEVYARPFRFSINTNGVLLTDKVINAVSLYSSRFNEFMISLDGPNEQTVDNQRGSGVFKELLEGVKRLKSAAIPFGFYCTVTSINVNKLNETAELALALGADWIKFNNFLLAGPELMKDMIPKQELVNSAAEKLNCIALSNPGKIQGTILDMHEFILKHKKGELTAKPDKAYSCGAGIGKIAVFPDGRVTPCDHLPQLTLGNITEQPLEDILRGEEMQKFTRFMAQSRSDFERCKNCRYINFCNGGCPVEALSLKEAIGYDRHSCLKTVLGEL